MNRSVLEIRHSNWIFRLPSWTWDLQQNFKF